MRTGTDRPGRRRRQRNERRDARGRAGASETLDGRDEDDARGAHQLGTPRVHRDAPRVVPTRSRESVSSGRRILRARGKPRMPLDTSFQPRTPSRLVPRLGRDAASPPPRRGTRVNTRVVFQKIFPIYRQDSSPNLSPVIHSASSRSPPKYPRLDRYHRRVPRSTSISLRSPRVVRERLIDGPRRPDVPERMKHDVRSIPSSPLGLRSDEHAQHGRHGDSHDVRERHTRHQEEHVRVGAEHVAHQKFTHQTSASSRGRRAFAAAGGVRTRVLAARGRIRTRARWRAIGELEASNPRKPSAHAQDLSSSSCTP